MPTLATPAISAEINYLHELMTRKRWQEATRLGKHLLSRNPDSAFAETLGKRLVDAKMLSMAVEWLGIAVTTYPDNVSLHCSLAEALTTAKELRQAASVWVATLELDPRCESAHRHLPKILMDLGLFDEARVACELAVQVVTDSVSTYEALGRLDEFVGENDAAIEHYSIALTLKPGLLRVRNRRALLFVNRGDWAAARADLERLAVDQPKDAEVKFLLSRVLAKMGDTEGAIQQLQRVVALRPRSPGASY